MRIPAQQFDLQAAGNDTPFKIALCGLDMDIPSTPEGGEFELKYHLPKDLFEQVAPSLLNKPLKMALPAVAHDNEDGSPAEPIGVITGWGVEDSPEGLPEGTYAIVTGTAWERDFPLEVSIMQENKDDWGSSWELSRGDEKEDVVDDEGRVTLCSDENPYTFDGAVLLPRTAAAYQEYTKVLCASGKLESVYKDADDPKLPESIKKLSQKKREVFVGAFNNSFRGWTKDKDKNYDSEKKDMENRERYAFAIANAAVNKLDAAASGDDEEKKIRSETYGIPILEGIEADEGEESDFADPVNHLFNVHLTKDELTEEEQAQVKAAPSRFALMGHLYEQKARRVVYNRITTALEKFGLGAFRAVAASALFENLQGFEEGTPEGGGETKMTEEELKQKVTELQQEIEVLQAAQAKYASGLAEVLKIQATAGVDADPTVEDMLTVIQETRELLCSVLPEDKQVGPLRNLVASLVDALKAEQAAKQEVEEQKEAQEQFEEIKDRYPVESHDDVKSCCLKLARGVELKASSRKLIELLPQASLGSTEEPPDLSASKSQDEQKYELSNGQKMTVAEIMLQASGRSPD